MDTDKLKHGFDFDVIDITAQAIVKKTPKRDSSLDSLSTAEDKIENIFQKMQKKGDFPSFTQQISDINKILKLKYASAKDIANVIMRDFSLSNKLLQLVNSSFYGNFRQGGISSVEKAMIILGADQVQQAAASLMLFEHMQTNSHNNELKEIAVRTFMSGLIAKELAIEKNLPDADQFLICAMFHRLGENLIAYYYPEKRETIVQFASRNNIATEHAFRIILGISCQELGAGIAKRWGLPDDIIQSMQIVKPGKQAFSRIELSQVQLLGTVASFSNSLCDIRFKISDPKKRIPMIAGLIQQYRGRFDADNDRIREILNKVINNIKQNSSHLNINTDDCKVLFNQS